MFRLLRILPVILMVSFVVGPVSAATPVSSHQVIAQAAPAATLASVNGTVTDNQGGPVAGASLFMVGPASYETTSDAGGKFAFASVKPGIYSLAITKPGYNPTTQEDFPVAPGSSQTLAIVLQLPTLTSLKEIGSVTAVRTGTFNTTAASVANITAQTYADQGQPQVQRILDQTPGVVVDHPGTSATNAAPGAITFPSIRGGLGFETASLIDGHPLAVGLFGDYVTTFLNSYVLQNTELIKGPGATSPSVNYAIGGTINFRTKDPTRDPKGTVVLGMDRYGGMMSNWLYTGSSTNGRFGWVFDYGVNGSSGPLGNVSNMFNISGGGITINGTATGFTTNRVPGAATNGIINNPFFYASTLEACCFPVAQTYVNKTELAKLRYNLSSVTALTASYLGSQTWTDQNGNHVNGFNQLFDPCGTGASAGAVVACPSYTGSLPNGSKVFTWQNIFQPSGEWEVNNEPIFQAEMRTTFKKDNVLLRWYGASINRLQYNALDSPLQQFSQAYQLFGTIGSGAGLQTFNGNTATAVYPTGVYQCPTNPNAPPNFSTNPYKNQPAGATTSTTCFYKPGAAPGTFTLLPNAIGATITRPTNVLSSGTYFRSAEEDRIQGLSFEYDHYLKDTGNLISLGYDTSAFRTHAYDYLNSPNAPFVPEGSRTRYGTLLLRGAFQVTPKLRTTLATYFNTYYQRYSADGGTTFKDFNSSHFDPRVALEYRRNNNISYRFAMGSAIAPPYLGLLNAANTLPGTPAPGALFLTNSAANGTLVPETSFGYNFGGDFRFGHGGVDTATFDVYSTTLWNQFIRASAVTCQAYDQPTQTCVNATTPQPGELPLVTSANYNLGTAKYQGIELGLRHDPAVGFGGLMQAALLRAYPYNLPACFYSTNPVTACNANSTNLGIVPGVNFYGSGSFGSPGGFNAVNNHSIPYAQGYGEVRYRWHNGAQASFGETYYGSHNSLNVPAFLVANANVRLPVGKDANFQLSADNVFGVYSNAYITAFGGIAVPLVQPNTFNAQQGLTNANVIGPTQIRFLFTKYFDFGKH